MKKRFGLIAKESCLINEAFKNITLFNPFEQGIKENIQILIEKNIIKKYIKDNEIFYDYIV